MSVTTIPHQQSLVDEPEPGLLGMLERVAMNPEVSVDKLEKLLELKERVDSVPERLSLADRVYIALAVLLALTLTGGIVRLLVWALWDGV